MPRHGQFHDASAAASSWDSDNKNVFYVGMEYPHNMGACSQKTPASFHPVNDGGGCSQSKPAVYVDAIPAVTVGGSGISDAKKCGVGASAGSSRTLTSVVPHPPQPMPPLPLASLSSIPAPASAFITREAVLISQPSTPCRVEGCEKTAFNLIGASPGVLCEGHLRDGMQRIAHNDRIYGKTRLSSEGITRPAHDSKGSKHETETENRYSIECAFVKQEPIIAAPASRNQPEIAPERQMEPKSVAGVSGVAAPSESKRCQHPGCDKTPEYGHEGVPPILCKSHKRAGMYTTRDGRLLLSTRDGKAMNRKLCEVIGCQVQPSYGPSGSTRPRFCSEHKEKGRVGLKNRLCLFPGCLTRPHYGLTKGRAVYCAAHKKDGMVHILRESILLERELVVRSREESRRKVAERKMRQAAAAAAGIVAKNGKDDGAVNDGDDDDDDDEEWTEESEFGRRKSRRVSSKRKKSRFEKQSGTRSKARRNREGWSRKTRSPSPLSSSRSRSWSPSQDTEGKAPADPGTIEDCTSAFPLFSRLPEDGVASVTAPSVEIRLLQHARECARAEAEASGTGKRARVPSRKLLEASGALEDGGAQWMTREIKIKETDATIKKELRTHSKAAGLNAGEVIAHAGGGGDGSATDTGGGSSASAKTRAKKRAVEGFPPPAAVDKIKIPLERAWTVSVSDGAAREGGSATAAGDATVSTPKRGKQSRNGHDGEDGRGAGSEASRYCFSSGKQKAAAGGGGVAGFADSGEGQGGRFDHTECEFGDCSKTARFGVNGTVRYCKTHRLFGMHEIPKKR